MNFEKMLRNLIQEQLEEKTRFPLLESPQGNDTLSPEELNKISFNTLTAQSVFSDEAVLEEQTGGYQYEVSLSSSPDEQVVQRFMDSLYAGKREAFLSAYSMDELKKMDLYLIEGENAGFAIKDGDDIVSVHNNSNLKGLSREFMRKAKEAGGTKLDHFDGFLSGLYRKYGFTDVYDVYQWDEQYKPKGWTYDAVDISNPNTSIYSGAIENMENLDREEVVRAEDDYEIKINPADKVLQYRYGRPDVILRRIK